MDRISFIRADTPQCDVREALRQYKEGKLTTTEIAEKYGVCAATLTVWATKAGFDLRKRGRRTLLAPTARHRDIMKLVGKVSLTEIAKRFGLHKQHVHRIIKRWSDWKPPKKAPYSPGDIILFNGRRLQVLSSNAACGTLRDVKDGKMYINFTWNGPAVLKKVA